jgi:hypothetical protein
MVKKMEEYEIIEKKVDKLLSNGRKDTIKKNQEAKKYIDYKSEREKITKKIMQLKN